MQEFELNALGRNDVEHDWQAFHMDQNGVHRDMRGVRVMPFKEWKTMLPEEVAEWMWMRREVPVSLTWLRR